MAAPAAEATLDLLQKADRGGVVVEDLLAGLDAAVGVGAAAAQALDDRLAVPVLGALEENAAARVANAVAACRVEPLR